MANAIPQTPVDLTEIIDAYFPNAKLPAKRIPVPDVEKSFFQRVNDHAMADLAGWVPDLFPQAQRARSGYRVRSVDLGRSLEEDISIQPEGIVDFGLHDMGDENEGKRTPIALVAEHEDLPADKAAYWLCDVLQLNPKALGWSDGEPADVSEFEVLDAPTADMEIPGFKRDKKGRIEATIENVVRAVGSPAFCGLEIAFDHFRDETMLTPPRQDAWRALSDAEYTGLRIALEQRGFKPVGREMMRDALDFHTQFETFDSATHWLNGLEWDGVPRIEQFFDRYFGAGDSEYIRAVSVYTWTALAGRVLSPGCQADMMPILVGPQGSRKTTGVKAMAPAPEHFFEVHFDAKEEDIARLMRGRLIGEVGELRGLHSREIEHIKNFVSRTHENWVPKFKEFAHTFPRRCLFIGTTNKDEFLGDETGERRFLPFNVGRVDVEGIDVDRNQLWAEAKVRFLAEGVLWRQAEQLAQEVHRHYKMHDSLEDDLKDWLHRPMDDFEADGEPEPRYRHAFTIAQAWRALNGGRPTPPTPIQEKRVARVLRAMGCERTTARIDGKPRKAWRYEPKEENDADE